MRPWYWIHSRFMSLPFLKDYEIILLVIPAVINYSAFYCKIIIIIPSDAHEIKIRSCSRGAHWTQFTEPECPLWKAIFYHSFVLTSFQIDTSASKEDIARILPKRGWAQEIDQRGLYRLYTQIKLLLHNEWSNYSLLSTHIINIYSPITWTCC